MKFFKDLMKFVPVFILAGLMIAKVDALIAAPLAFLAAVPVAWFVAGKRWDECLNAALDSVKNILVALFILMLAYAMANCFMGYGVGAAVVTVALKLGVTARTVAVIGLVCTAALSVATGTSWGTFAACAPIFMWLSHIVGGNVYLTVCAIAGGACFGDNIGLISDTTIVSSGIQGVKVVDRIRHQGVWSLGCLILAAVADYVAGISMGLSNVKVESFNLYEHLNADAMAYLAENRPVALDLLSQVDSGVPVYMVVPLILVIVLAVCKLNTFACILSGILSSYVLGLLAGTAGSVGSFLNDYIYPGFADAGAWVIPMMIWVAAFGGVMRLMDAFAPLARMIRKLSKKVRHLMGWNAVLSLLGNAALSDEMAQIVTIGPVIKQITEDNVEAETEEDMYKLKLRNATFGDAMGVFGSQLIPWHVYLGFYVGVASAVYPLVHFTQADIISYNFLAVIAVVTLLLLTFTGLDRFVPLFGMPSEPKVRLKEIKEEKKE
ncbi:MAG: Na+/H+ antiporter NhaC family protein [Firmicutes bacterium]|nr:Na+/H+ antiporter NhaC family protein [Bacillota bacterium]